MRCRSGDARAVTQEDRLTECADRVAFHPLTPDRWGDFTTLFGKNGACAGCWCMWWRQTRSEFQQKHGSANRRAMKRIVDSGRVPGVLGYVTDRPVGWAAVAPREEYASLERSRVLRRIDDEPVWSLVCLFVHRDDRGRGIGVSMIHGAVQYAFRQGAMIVEAYPTNPRGRRLDASSSFRGTPEMFKHAGFRVCARPSEASIIMRVQAPQTRRR
jgi:GNAT superfamily N-acetyltransferase